MAVTRITKTRKGTEAINYVLRPKDKNKERVLSVSGLNVSTTFTREQMDATRESYGKNKINPQTGKEFVQNYRLIQSFSDTELNPESDEDIQKCNDVGYALAGALYPDHEVLVVTHGDGVGGKLHNHLIINATSFVTGKQLRSYETDWQYISEKSDGVLKNFGMSPIKKQSVAKDRTTQAERKLADKGVLPWKDDLKDKIGAVLSAGVVSSREEFITAMDEEYGIDVNYRGKKGMSYAFTDDDGKKRKSRAGKLGEMFQIESVDSMLSENLNSKVVVAPVTVVTNVIDEEYKNKLMAEMQAKIDAKKIKVAPLEEVIKENVEAPQIVEVVDQQQQQLIAEKEKEEALKAKKREADKVLEHELELARQRRLKELEDMRHNYKDVRKVESTSPTGKTTIKSLYWDEGITRVPLSEREVESFKVVYAEIQAERKAKRQEQPQASRSELER